MNGREILAHTKKQVEKINNMITESFSGVPFAFTALMS